MVVPTATKDEIFDGSIVQIDLFPGYDTTSVGPVTIAKVIVAVGAVKATVSSRPSGRLKRITGG